ncbi:phage tail protein [Metasolibacillus sp.]|uniref:phage tail protein n=1 Tax=Metasolibacillus sp. TaxID=2703680 RepID=UPI0025E6169B|nr:phage tail protein [Metasolibacillus sp.]MCT6925409.1 phage tail protein [Metasolibacillus sp.]MCT6941564.1 phage tail protein [Metasolibacillus sp.]
MKGGDKLFYVTSLDNSQVEPLINIGTDFKMEQDVEGTYTVSFTTFPHDNPAYDILQSESVITVDGNDFRIKVFNDNAHSKTVTALSIFYDHLKTFKHGTFEGSHTLNNHLNFALGGTGWTFTVDAAIANVTNYIRSFGNDNVVRLVQKICKAHEVEFEILPNKKLHFAKEIGGNNDYQYRYKHNISSIVLQEDTTNLATYIKGFGKDGLTVEYTSPNSSIFGVREEEPVKDERFTDATALLNYIKSKLQDEPQLAIETTIPELVSRANGERVWLIYEPLGVEMSTRILKQTKVLIDGELITSSVVFGNSLPKSSEDILADHEEKIGDTNEYIDETKEELNEKIEEAEGEFRSSITQTNERITLEVEQLNTSIATVDIKADNINLSVNNRITNEVAAINVRANAIELSVSNLEQNTNASISVMQSSINLKVDKGGSITDINLTPGVATINADKINLNGAVMVNGDISGATNINVNRDVLIGNNLYLRGSGNRAIVFGQNQIQELDGGELYIGSRTSIGAFTRFHGQVDFSAAYTVGLSVDNANSVNGYTMSYSTSGGKKYMTFRQNGSYLGQVEIN